MAQLAIKGHNTRGKEVIQLLEMLGGKNIYKLDGKKDLWYILSNSTIEHTIYLFEERGFTLEEFLEKFPYKVGDKVYNIIHNENQTITEVAWDFQEDEIVYQINNNDYLFVNYLQPYKEETMEENRDEPKAPILFNRYDYAEGKCGYVIPDGYEFDCIKEGFQTEIILKPKKPQYPNDYEECCEALGILDNRGFGFINLSECENILMSRFIQLKRCRDAYWKIAGKELGLGKSWEPDWNNGHFEKYYIYLKQNEIEKSSCFFKSHFLAFPTEAMRDAFYENFRELIEQCKELL